MSQDNGDAKAFIADLVARSRAAQKQIEHYSQEQVDALIRAMVWSVARPGVAEEIAQFTVSPSPASLGRSVRSVIDVGISCLIQS